MGSCWGLCFVPFPESPQGFELQLLTRVAGWVRQLLSVTFSSRKLARFPLLYQDFPHLPDRSPVREPWTLGYSSGEPKPWQLSSQYDSHGGFHPRHEMLLSKTNAPPTPICCKGQVPSSWTHRVTSGCPGTEVRGLWLDRQGVPFAMEACCVVTGFRNSPSHFCPMYSAQKTHIFLRAPGLSSSEVGGLEWNWISSTYECEAWSFIDQETKILPHKAISLSWGRGLAQGGPSSLGPGHNAPELFTGH